MILSVCVVSLSRKKNGQKTLQCPCWSLLVFFDKKNFSLRLMYFLQESDRKSISCKNLARFLQEIFFLSGSCKKCIFCQNLARFVFFVKILQESCKNCICFQPGISCAILYKSSLPLFGFLNAFLLQYGECYLLVALFCCFLSRFLL